MVDSSTARPRSARVRPAGLLMPRPGRTAPQRTKAGTQDSRPHNRSLVLERLYHQGPMTRPELARAIGLTAPTISALVAELEGDGLISDIGPRRGARVGKPAGLLRIVDDGSDIVVVDLAHSDRFTGAVVDLRGVVIERAEVRLDDAVGSAALDLLFRLVETLVGRARHRILGIGVGSPGIIDDAGLVHHAAHLEWLEVPLAERLASTFAVPAYVGNDVNVATLGVLHFRKSEGQNLMVVTIEHGVGAGLVVGGELVEGEQFAAGEIGHITVDDDGPDCVCGRRGCLDLFMNAFYLRARLDATTEAQRPAVLAEAGRALGRVLAPIVSTLNLNDVVIIGPAELIDGPMIESALATTRARTLPAIGSSVTIRSLADDGDLGLLGAASLVLAGELGVL